MPIYVSWDNPEKTVIRQRFVGDWTLAEYYETTLRLYRKMWAAKHKIHWFVDFSATPTQPKYLIIAAQNIVNLLPKNCETIFLLHTNQVLRLSANIIIKLNPYMKKSVKFINSREEIYNILETKKAAVATS